MTFFEQTVYCIELFIQRRIQLGFFGGDKYFLYGIQQNNQQKMATNTNQNSKFLEEIDSILFEDPNAKDEVIQEEEKTGGFNSMLYSGWEHPFKHFNIQLQNLKCSNSVLDRDCIFKGLQEIMAQINGKRMYTGADIRLNGIQLNKIEPANVILFTALGPRYFTETNLNDFLNCKPFTHNFFNQIFRFDQKLHVVQFQKPNVQLQMLAQNNGGTYYLSQSGFQLPSVQKVFFDFEGLKHFSSHLASIIESVAVLEFETDMPRTSDQPKIMNLLYKQSIVQSQSSQLMNSHRTNMETKLVNTDNKLKWPLPFGQKPQTSRLEKQANHTIWMGTSIPSIVIDSQPTSLQQKDIESLNQRMMLADVIPIHDPVFQLFFTENFQIDDQTLENKKWDVRMKGQQEKYTFGFIRGKREENNMISVCLYVFPMNFPEFLDLMDQIDVFTQYSIQAGKSEAEQGGNQQYEKAKWKHQFDSYNETVPPYYAEYLNTCLRFVDQRERQKYVSFDLKSKLGNLQFGGVNKEDRHETKMVGELTKQIRKHQVDLEYKDECRFTQSKEDHERFHAFRSFEERIQVPLLCCQNIQLRKPVKDQSKVVLQNQENVPNSGEQEQQVQTFELINESLEAEDFVSRVMWQLNQCSFESLQPLNFSKLFDAPEERQEIQNKFSYQLDGQEQNNHDDQAPSSTRESLERNQVDMKKHQTPVQYMSDVDSKFKLKLKTLIRDPELTQAELIENIKPFMGNPFIAPGTLGCKSQAQKQLKEMEQNGVNLRQSQDSTNGSVFQEQQSDEQMSEISSVSEESNFIADTYQFSIDEANKKKHKHQNGESKAQTTIIDQNPSNSNAKEKQENLEDLPLFESMTVAEIKSVFLKMQNYVTEPCQTKKQKLTASCTLLSRSMDDYLKQFDLTVYGEINQL